jgi:predicted small secreted protein
MRRFGIGAVLLAVVTALAGCSQQTQQKAGKALNQTGEALESAAKDATAVTRGAMEGAAEAVKKNNDQSTTEPAK